MLAAERSARYAAELTRLMRSVSCMGSSLLDSRRTSCWDRLRDSASSAHTWSSCSMPSSSGAATMRNIFMICAASDAESLLGNWFEASPRQRRKLAAPKMRVTWTALRAAALLISVSCEVELRRHNKGAVRQLRSCKWSAPAQQDPWRRLCRLCSRGAMAPAQTRVTICVWLGEACARTVAAWRADTYISAFPGSKGRRR